MKSFGWVQAMSLGLLFFAGAEAHAQFFPPRPDRRPPREDWRPVHRFYDGRNHFQTLDQFEGMNAGMRYEGISFYVLTQPLPDTQPLFRCLVEGSMDHFISLDAGCEGRRTEGLYGYVAQRQSPRARVAIYRCYANGDHLSTTNPNECVVAGYRVEGIQGFTVR